MYTISRASELELLGFSIGHVLLKIEGSEARNVFLLETYKGILEIVAEVMNNDDIITLADKVDKALQERDMPVEIKLSIFDYVFNLSERVLVHFKTMGMINEVRYQVNLSDNNLMVGLDRIIIDFYATYYVLDKILKNSEVNDDVPWREDVIDNPTSDDFEEAKDLDHTVIPPLQPKHKFKTTNTNGDEDIQ